MLFSCSSASCRCCCWCGFLLVLVVALVELIEVLVVLGIMAYKIVDAVAWIVVQAVTARGAVMIDVGCSHD